MYGVPYLKTQNFLDPCKFHQHFSAQINQNIPNYKSTQKIMTKSSILTSKLLKNPHEKNLMQFNK